MSEDTYDGEFYFPNFEHTSTKDLSDQEDRFRVMARQLRDRAEHCERLADERQWELNYRNNADLLKPLMAEDARLRDIIHTPGVTKTNRIKAEKLAAKIYKAIWGVMKFNNTNYAKELLEKIK